jgi:hypothetical protein
MVLKQKSIQCKIKTCKQTFNLDESFKTGPNKHLQTELDHDMYLSDEEKSLKNALLHTLFTKNCEESVLKNLADNFNGVEVLQLPNRKNLANEIKEKFRETNVELNLLREQLNKSEH